MHDVFIPLYCHTPGGLANFRAGVIVDAIIQTTSCIAAIDLAGCADAPTVATLPGYAGESTPMFQSPHSTQLPAIFRTGKAGSAGVPIGE